MMRILLASLATTLLIALLSGCYRVSAPPDPQETVRIEIRSNHARLVRSQGYLEDAIAHALTERLGWRVSPNGTATLQLVIDEESIDANADDRRSVTSSWRVRVRGTALLVTRGGSLLGDFTGLGNSTSLAGPQGEPEALQAAATQAAEDLAGWLAVRANEIAPPRS